MRCITYPAHRVCSCRQVMHARWEPLLAIPSSPELGRGLCPAGGPQYAAAVFHYARTLALAAKAAGAQARGDSAGAAKLTADADLELALLQARRPAGVPRTVCSSGKCFAPAVT